MRTKEEIETLIEHFRKREKEFADLVEHVKEALEKRRKDYTLEDLQEYRRKKNANHMYRRILEWTLGEPVAWCDRVLTFMKHDSERHSKP